MLPGANFGNAFFTATATSLVITSANAYIIGILFHGSATNSARIYQGLTATGTAAAGSAGSALSGLIYANGTTGSATVNPATFFRFPAYASGGITLNIVGAGDPNVTLFWNPT